MERFSYSRNGGVDLSCSVRVSVPSTIDVDGKTYYKVAMKTVKTSPAKSWEVVHRYSEFLALKQTLHAHLSEQTDLGKTCPGCQHYMHALGQFDFPRKHLFSSNSAMVIKYRQISLQAFVSMLASHTFTTSPRCPTCSGHAFELVRDFFVVNDNPAILEKLPTPIQEAGKSESLRSALTVDNFLEVHPVARDTVVNSAGEFLTSPAKPSPGEPSPSKQRGASTQPPPAPMPSAKSPAKEGHIQTSQVKVSSSSLVPDAPLDVDRYSFESGVPIASKPPVVVREESADDDDDLSFDGVRISDQDDENAINMDFLAPKLKAQPSMPLTF
ncbi:hypothetical protein SPRG_18268 [Saprolegnia parasitica CBS 223.65]|uniref:PX domain-containing protein n=1 Tax=Saprolegnia parasitica (strain CBS 223.65) TaxID=695850 RepID=A0A067BPH2_SAPPC|nr:hypothetical protein SPRG_18268 [Saprolegnia parasitica CBS 223.65]KDO16196.1 hypothetical protein SPRG_18268 [Saprolegnia parasitica CBS 223.65]|eukprot:XP_012213097.1 hypothetical protein SPRG_18268 [Saprolegnia parasitica CBS 223.65]